MYYNLFSGTTKKSDMFYEINSGDVAGSIWIHVQVLQANGLLMNTRPRKDFICRQGYLQVLVSFITILDETSRHIAMSHSTDNTA